MNWYHQVLPGPMNIEMLMPIIPIMPIIVQIDVGHWYGVRFVLNMHYISRMRRCKHSRLDLVILLMRLMHPVMTFKNIKEGIRGTVRNMRCAIPIFSIICTNADILQSELQKKKKVVVHLRQTSLEPLLL